MRLWSNPALRSLVLPGGVLLFAVIALLDSGWLRLDLATLMFLYYGSLAAGMLLAWRFHSSRILLALLVLFLARQALVLFAVGQPAVAVSALGAVGVIVPLNFVLIALIRERGLSTEIVAPVGSLLLAECIIVSAVCRTAERATPLTTHTRHLPAKIAIPDYALLFFAAAGMFLLGRFLLTRKPVDSALLWSLMAFLLSLRSTVTDGGSTLYQITAAGILAASIIENSYLLAYHDELTALPSRRAFNDALLRLQAPYSIAVVDIDHFKKFNDTYGHDTGDQVLRLVAGRLAGVTGGGEAYRCGGEEFTILFPGKRTAEVVEHLERLREAVESAEFHLRGNERRQTPRGPDRRNQRLRGRPRKGHVIRQLQEACPAPLSVTVSIGVAASPLDRSDPEAILQLADKALYRAKANGRNRVETAASLKRTRAKAVGIA